MAGDDPADPADHSGCHGQADSLPADRASGAGDNGGDSADLAATKPTPLARWQKNYLSRREQVRKLQRARPSSSGRVEALAWARINIDPARLKEEPSLRYACWPQYGYMSPMARTRLFAQAYSDTLARLLTPSGATPGPGRPIVLEACSHRQISAYWRARQQADLSGLPYDVYLEPILRAILRNAKRDQLPQPNQLFDKLSLPRSRSLLTSDMLATRLYAPDWDQRLFAPAYRSDPVQLRARKLLLRAVRKADAPVAVLRDLVGTRQALPLSVAKQVFDRDALRAALGPVVDARQRVHVPTKADYTPGCLGMIHNPPHPACVTCPALARCVRVEAAVTARVVALTGSENPRLERVRAQTRARVRKHRAKAKGPAEPPETPPET